MPKNTLNNVKESLENYTRALEHIDQAGLEKKVFWKRRVSLAKEFENTLAPMIQEIEAGTPQALACIATIIKCLTENDMAGLNPFSYEFLQLMSDKIWAIFDSEADNATQKDLILKIMFANIGKNKNWNEEQGLPAVHISLQYFTINIIDPHFSARTQAIKLIDVNYEKHLKQAIFDLFHLLRIEQKRIFIKRINRIKGFFTENVALQNYLADAKLEDFAELSPATAPVASGFSGQNIDEVYSLGFSPRSNKSISSPSQSEEMNNSIFSLPPPTPISNLPEDSWAKPMVVEDVDIEFAHALNDIYLYIPFGAEIDWNNTLWVTVDSNTLIKFSYEEINSLREQDLYNLNPDLMKTYIALRVMASILKHVYQEKFDDLLTLSFTRFCTPVLINNCVVNYQTCYTLLYQFFELKKMISKNDAYIHRYQLLAAHPLCMINQQLKQLAPNFELFTENQVSNNPSDVKQWVFTLEIWYERLLNPGYAKNPTVNFVNQAPKEPSFSLFAHPPETSFGFSQN